MVERERPHVVPGQVQPGAHLAPELGRVGPLLQQVGPLGEGRRLRRELDRGAALEAREHGVEVLPERAPGQPVHGEVMDDDEQPVAVLPQVERRDPNERPPLQAQAALQLLGMALDGSPLLVCWQAGQVVAREGDRLGDGCDRCLPAVAALVEAHSQGGVTLEHALDRLTHDRGVEWRRPLEHDAQVPVVGIRRAALDEEPGDVGQQGEGRLGRRAIHAVRDGHAGGVGRLQEAGTGHLTPGRHVRGDDRLDVGLRCARSTGTTATADWCGCRARGGSTGTGPANRVDPTKVGRKNELNCSTWIGRPVARERRR